MRMLLCLLLVSGLAAAPTLAQNAAPPVTSPELQVSQDDISAWQDSISGQLEAFRAGDGETALRFAAMAFKVAFPDPASFYATIAGSGYRPLVESLSHSFGTFKQTSDDTAWQEVVITGPDRQVYIAIYQLNREAEGWRVAGVTMSGRAGLSV